MRTTVFRLFSVLGLVIGLFGPQADAQTVEPKGLIIFKNSGLASDKNALVAEYSEIKFNPMIVNGRKVDGSMFRIVASEFVDSVEYPDLKRGVFTTSDQIESFKSVGQKMMALSEKFPTAKAILAPRIEEMKLAAGKFNTGLKLINGAFVTESQLASLLNPSAILPRSPFDAPPAREVQTLKGVRYTNAVATRIGSSRIYLKHDGGSESLEYSQFDDANLDLLFPGHLADKQRQEAEEAAMVEQNLFTAKRAEEEAKLATEILVQAEAERRIAEENAKLAEERAKLEAENLEWAEAEKRINLDALKKREEDRKLAMEIEERSEAERKLEQDIQEQAAEKRREESRKRSEMNIKAAEANAGVKQAVSNAFSIILIFLGVGAVTVIIFLCVIQTGQRSESVSPTVEAGLKRLQEKEPKLEQDRESVGTALLAPLFWFVDELGKSFGIIFVVGVWVIVVFQPGCDPSPPSSTPNYSSTTPNYSSTTPNYSSTTPNYSSTTPNYSSTGLDLNDPVALERFRKKNERDAERHKNNVLRDLTPSQRRAWEAENREALKAF